MTVAAQPVGPATPHAFGCHACVDSDRRALAAERMTGRLLELLAKAEAREARQRDEIGDLERRLTRHQSTWETVDA